MPMLINRFVRPVGFGLLGCLLFAATARAEKTAPTPIAQIKHDQPVDFQKEVLPILKKHCLACHNATVAESGLVLENPTRILKGGDSGAAVVPKKSGESLLLKRATGEVDPQMP